MCLFGGLVAAWSFAEWLNEEVHAASISQCEIYRSFTGGIGVYSEGILMISCKTSYSKNGIQKTANLISRAPADFDSSTEKKKVWVTVSTLSPGDARFASQHKDWSSVLAKVLFLEFIGAMCILQGKRAGL
jgi:hypothetical protein